MIFTLLVTTWAMAATLLVNVPAAPSGGSYEAVIQLSSELSCTPMGRSRVRSMAVGEFNVGGRIQRFEFFSGARNQRLLLGRVSEQNLSLEYTPTSRCRVLRMEASVNWVATSNQVLRHAPFIVSRPDQITSRFTDLPLAVVYHTEGLTGGNRRITYTAIFSDEDELRDRAGTDFQMARYGRRTDIEWLYAVELDAHNAVVSREYHGSLINIGDLAYDNGNRMGVGHSSSAFEGHFIEGTDHPIIYNVQTNNVFADRPFGGGSSVNLTGHFLDASTRSIAAPEARELAMVREPWMYQVSDEELHVEHRLSSPSYDWLFVVVRGAIPYDPAAFVAEIVLSDGQVFNSGGGHGDVDRLGEDVWHREAITALPVGRASLAALRNGILHGTFTQCAT